MAHRPILELLDGFRRSKVLFAAVRLNIFDTLSTHGPAGLTSDQIATNLSVSSDGVDRLLRACAALGLLSTSREVKPFGGESPKLRFALNSLSKKYLVSQSPDSLLGYVRHSDDVLYKLWDHLHESVKTGKPSWEQAFPSTIDGDVDIFEQVYKTEDDKRRFLNAMHGMAKTSIDAIVSSLERFIAESNLIPSSNSSATTFGLRDVVDLGGGSGALAFGIAAKFKGVSAIVVDLPLALSEAQRYLDQSLLSTIKEEAETASRIQLREGNFFEESSQLPQGDLYLLSRILHDWDDAKSEIILRRTFSALRPGGAVVLVEKLLDDSDNDLSPYGAACGPLDSHLQSLNMLVQTEGRERTAGQFGSLLEKVGFKRLWTCKTGTAFDMVAAFKE